MSIFARGRAGFVEFFADIFEQIGGRRIRAKDCRLALISPVGFSTD